MKRLLIIAVLIAGGVWYYQNNSPTSPTIPWDEVSLGDFDSRVLKSPKPALVYFDTAEECRGADVVFARLRYKWKERLVVFHFKAESHPEFARGFGVNEHVLFALFEHGRMIKQIGAPQLIQPLLGPNNEVSSLEAFYEDFLSALERFANLR